MNFKQGATRLLYVALGLGMASGAWADNKLSIDNFNITNTEPKRVAIYMENDADLAALQFNVVMPEGLSIVGTERNADRFSPGQNLSYSPKKNLFFVNSGQRNTFVGTEGVLVYIDVQATEAAVLEGGLKQIELTNIVYSTAAGQSLPGDKTSSTQVSVQDGSGVLSTEAELVINPSASRRVNVALDNSFDVQGLQMTITVPEGFAIAGNELHATGRISNGSNVSLTPRADGVSYGVVIADYNGNAVVNTGKGDILWFDLVAPYNFEAETAEVTFTDFQMSNRNNKTVYGEGCSMTVINGKKTLDTANASVEALQSKLDAVLEQIKTDCPLVADKFTGTELQTRIDELKAAIEAAYNNHTLNSDYESVMAPAAGIEADIDSYLAQAQQAQADEVQRRADNEAAYNADLAAFESLQAQLDAAKKEIADNYADFADPEAEAAAQKAIDDMKAKAAEVYASVAEEGIYTYKPDTAAVEAQIAALITDAKARADEADRAAANKAAYEADLAKIADLQAQLDAAKKEIADNYADFADADAEAAAQKTIDDLKTAVENAYKAVENEGNYSYKLDTEAAEAQIEKLVSDAKLRADEAARVAANKAAYEADLAKIADLQALLNAAKAEAREKYNGFEDKSSEDYIQTQLDIMKLGVENAYAAVAAAGLYNYNLDTANLEARIEALVPAAAEAYRVDCNEKAYDADLAALAKLMDEFDAALDVVRTLYPSYIDSEYVADMRAKLNDTRDACDKEFADVKEEGLYESQVNAETLSADIKQMLETIKTVGIDAVYEDADLTDAEIYTLDGQRHNSLVKGQLNIIRLANGTVVKKMVK